MNTRCLTRGAKWLLGVAIGCALIAAGCQDGSGPTGIASPDPALNGKPQPQADPAIVFVADSQSGQQLKVMNADGSNVSTIYSWSGLATWLPSWSPGATSIAFAKEFELYLIDVAIVNGTPTGMNPRLLLQRGADILNQPAWSPLGNLIAFTRHTSDGSPATLEIIPPTGGTPTVVYTSPPGYESNYPAWNRNATQIAFVERDPAGGGSAVLSVDVGTGIVTTILSAQQTGGNGGIHVLDWGRTRDALTFQMYVGNDIGIYTYVIGGVLTRVTGGLHPCWSPNDAEILYKNGPRLSKVQVSNGRITNFQVGGTLPDWRRF